MHTCKAGCKGISIERTYSDVYCTISGKLIPKSTLTIYAHARRATPSGQSSWYSIDSVREILRTGEYSSRFNKERFGGRSKPICGLTDEIIVKDEEVFRFDAHNMYNIFVKARALEVLLEMNDEELNRLALNSLNDNSAKRAIALVNKAEDLLMCLLGSKDKIRKAAEKRLREIEQKKVG